MVYINDITTDSWKAYNGSGNAHITLSNDSSLNDFIFSLDGKTEIGKLQNTESLQLLDANISKLYVKSRLPGASCPFRIWFYGNQKVIYTNIDKLNQLLFKQVPVPTNFKSISINEKPCECK